MMEEEQYKNRPGLSTTQIGRLAVNFLTALVTLITIGVGVVFVIVFVNPYWDINPYPPPTLPATVGSPTSTSTAAVTLPPTWTPGVTSMPPTWTPGVTSMPPTWTPVFTPSPVATTAVVEDMPFALQIGSPARIQNYIRVDDGCNWMGVGGQVFNLDGDPILELTIHLVGELEGLTPFDLFALTGSSTELGPGGFLFEISDHPITSQENMWIQLDNGAGKPLSEAIYLDTSESCTENLILVNFRQVR
jgi:hypothetical protein